MGLTDGGELTFDTVLTVQYVRFFVLFLCSPLKAFSTRRRQVVHYNIIVK